ncbi:PREDICTED: ICOS ligand-like [Cyprinodon variegatus]|uniref:ICOS ligand-like n=1 Tax=Cyprinodon variegatus TaxID=28743 RepID=UPI000742B19D|nr:PREDICTED: ICOS ligand-like [Cyprinodon variegatus]
MNAQMSVALWRGAALLLCCACLCAAVEEECVLGIVGNPVLLPCLYPDLSSFLNFSIEWRRNDEAVLRSLWKEDGDVETWSLNHVSISTDVLSTGDLSLTLPSAHPKLDRSKYSLFLFAGENQTEPLCTVSLRIAASFSPPEVMKVPSEENSTTYLCHSSGGYPQPLVHWIINDSQEPPNGSVETQALIDSHLYNLTSHLTLNFSSPATVSCTIENQSMNETLTSKYGETPKVRRASEGMWIFSTVLCVVVALMVIAGLCYQINLDKISKRRKKEFEKPHRGRRQRYKQAAEVMMEESKETDV